MYKRQIFERVRGVREDALYKSTLPLLLPLALQCILQQLHDAFDTFGVQSSGRQNRDDNGDLFYVDSFQPPPRRRYRMTGSRPTRPLGDMAQPSSGSLWAGWDMGQSDDGQVAGNGRSSPYDAEHPMRKYRKRKKNRRRSGRRSRNSRDRVGHALEVTTTTTTTATTTTEQSSNPVTRVCYSVLNINA